VPDVFRDILPMLAMTSTPLPADDGTDSCPHKDEVRDFDELRIQRETLMRIYPAHRDIAERLEDLLEEQLDMPRSLRLRVVGDGTLKPRVPEDPWMLPSVGLENDLPQTRSQATAPRCPIRPPGLLR
jgi:hypothetical protein